MGCSCAVSSAFLAQNHQCIASAPPRGARKGQVGGLASLREPRAGFVCRQEANRSPAQEAVSQARKDRETTTRKPDITVCKTREYRKTPPRKSEPPARPRKHRTRAASPPRRQP